MSEYLEAINKLNENTNSLQFKHSGIFTNSLLKTNDATQIIRDIRDEELVFFQGKKMADIDYELINNFGFTSTDGFAQHEFYKVLEDEINANINDLTNQLDNLVPSDLNGDYETSSDLEILKNIYKRTQMISKIWANSNTNMLDNETNQMLTNLKLQINEFFKILDDIQSYQNLIKSQKQKLSSSYDEPKNDTENI